MCKDSSVASLATVEFNSDNMRESLPTSYHQRLSFEDLEKLVEKGEAPEPDCFHVSSPFHAWSKEKNLKAEEIESIGEVPCDVLLWARGEPENPAATKLGGIPSWPEGVALPSEKRGFGVIPSKLRFLGQFNFLDSLDVLPELPTGFLSVWAPPEFEYSPDSVKCFWLDPEKVMPLGGKKASSDLSLFSEALFHAVLYRSADLVTEVDEDMARESAAYMQAVEECLKDKSKPMPEPPASLSEALELAPSVTTEMWHSSKFGGLEAGSQHGSDFDPKHFFMQLQSIQAVCDKPYPWIGHPERLGLDFSETGIHHESNEVMMGDMGELAFHLFDKGKVKTTFECG